MALSLIFNGISGTFDYVDSGNAVWGTPVATLADLQSITTDAPYTVRVVQATDSSYVWDGSNWILLNLVRTSVVGSSPNANGFSVDATNTITLQPANGTYAGLINSSNYTTLNAATSSNTVSTLVERDISGNFSAGTITASLTGAASLNVLTSAVGAANGVTPLDSSSKIP